MACKITKISAREILDSRGNPTIEAKVELNNGVSGKAAVPSGASTGAAEALELRDGDKKRYGGQGVLKAVKNVNQKIAKELIGKDAAKQREIDSLLIKLDGTNNKSRLGANAVLSVSLACARAAAAVNQLPLYNYLRQAYRLNLLNYKIPVPMFNIFNGGKHADTKLAVQELMIIPAGIKGFSRQLRAGAEIFHVLKKILQEKKLATNLGDEGGYSPNINSVEQGLDYIVQAIAEANYKFKEQVCLGMDVAASSFYDIKINKYLLEGKKLDSSAMVRWIEKIFTKYQLRSIEDGLAENDWLGWHELTKILGAKTLLVGDDLFVTNVERFAQGITEESANAILIKVNQIGTLSETMDCINLARQYKYQVVVSHRSGETSDDFIADLAVAVNADYAKMGSLARGERVAKWNRLMEIEHEL